MHSQIVGGIAVGSSRDFVLRPAERQGIIRLYMHDDAASPIRRRFSDSITDFTFRACYCSVLDEFWLSNLSDLHPRRVGVCPTPAHPFFNGPSPSALKQ